MINLLLLIMFFCLFSENYAVKHPDDFELDLNFTKSLHSNLENE